LYLEESARNIRDVEDVRTLQKRGDESPPTSPGEGTTLRPNEQKALQGMLKNTDGVSKNSPPTNSNANGTASQQQSGDRVPPRQGSFYDYASSYGYQNSTDKEYDSDSSSEGEGGRGGTWIVPLQNKARPRLEVRTADIEPNGKGKGNGDARHDPREESKTTNSASTSNGTAVDVGMGVTIIPPPETSDADNMSPLDAHSSTSGTLTVRTTAPLRIPNKRPESTFIDPEGDNWARPPPENIYEHLEKFFSEHDLDRPVIEASSGDTSPVVAEPVPPPLPISNSTSMNSDFDGQDHDNDDGDTLLGHGQAQISRNSHIRAKKSIRIVAQEHKKKIDRMSRAADTMARVGNTGLRGSDMLRKRSTKLWGSRLEEVTPGSLRAGSIASTIPESPSSTGGPSTCFFLSLFLLFW
jgi:hypothetical protein